MSFCASCGRQRDDTSRFCGGCGMEFGDTSVASDDKGSAEGMTRTDAAPGGTRVEPSAEQPDPFASWYYKEPGNSSGDAGSTWQPTETVLPAPPKAAGQSSSGFAEANPFTAGNPFSSANPVGAPAPPFPPAPLPVPPQRGGGGRKGLFIVLAVLVVLAAGGGAYALAANLGKHSTGQPPTAPTVTTSTPAGSSPTGGTTQHSSSPPSSASATPSPTLSLVAIASGVTGTAEPQVETLLSHYFHGINTHSYAEYASTLNPEEQAKQTQSEFNSGYSSTTDSGMTLTALTDNGNGLTATVSFTSRQSPAQSVDNSACNAWTLNLYLVSQGSGYLIGPAPSGYQPTYSNC